jgi:hypothetical protein
MRRTVWLLQSETSSHCEEVAFTSREKLLAWARDVFRFGPVEDHGDHLLIWTKCMSPMDLPPERQMKQSQVLIFEVPVDPTQP